MVFLTWGTRLYGKVDQVPGSCHVATMFFHLLFVPLVPLRTYIVRDGTTRRAPPLDRPSFIPTSRYSFEAVQIPLSIKSVLMGYFRGVLGLFIFVSALSSVLPALEQPEKYGFGTRSQLTATAITLGLIGIYWASRRLTRAGEKRAAALMSELGTADEQYEHDDPDESWRR